MNSGKYTDENEFGKPHRNKIKHDHNLWLLLKFVQEKFSENY